MRSLVSVLLIALIGLTVPLGRRALAQGPCGEAATVAAGDVERHRQALPEHGGRHRGRQSRDREPRPHLPGDDRPHARRRPAPDTLTHSVLPGEMLAASPSGTGRAEAIRGANPQLAEGAEPEVGQMLLVPTSP